MHPVLFSLPPFDFFGRSLGPITLHTYGVLLALGMILALWVVGREATKAGLDAARVTDLAIYVLIAGLVGAKVLLVVVEWRFYWAHPGDLWAVLRSGGVFYGGLLGAMPVAWYYTRRFALDGWTTADVLAPGVVLGQAVGRLGCLAAGCCHGRAAGVPWAVTFKDPYAYREVGTPLDIPLHPTQVYESVACLAIFGVLLFLLPRRRFRGHVVTAYVALYSTARFFIEFYRGDAVRGSLKLGVDLQLYTSQIIALGLLLVLAATVPSLMKKNRIAPAPAA